MVSSYGTFPDMGRRISTSEPQLVAAGKRLKEAMNRRGFTPTSLAQSTGLSRSTIDHFLHGQADMHLDDLRNIGGVLHVSPSWIAWGE